MLTIASFRSGPLCQDPGTQLDSERSLENKAFPKSVRELDSVPTARLRLSPNERNGRMGQQRKRAKGFKVQVNVTARHGDLAAATQEKISQKLQKLSRFHDRISTIETLIDLAKSDEPTVELIVAVAGASDFVSRVKAENGNLLGGVESAMQKLEEQLKKHKAKQRDHRSPPLRELAAGEEVDQDDDELDGDTDA